jgi:hypothetical protein
MDAKTRAITLIKYKPMIEGFKNAIAEQRKKGVSGLTDILYQAK